MYAHEKLSDTVASQCFNEMYPKTRNVIIQESDESCIIFCVLKKIGIMTNNGYINLDVFRKRIETAHQLDQRIVNQHYGETCAEKAEATTHKQDVCKKAKAFNDCTHLYKMLIT